MAYNKAREEKKWRLWKEAEEKQLRSLGVSSLLTVWRLPNSISGCRGQIEMLSHSSQTQGGQKNREIVYALPTLNTSLCLAAYIGRKPLPKSYWEVKHNGIDYQA